MDFTKDLFQIVFFARAGQGAKSIAEVLAQTAVAEGKFVQAFSFYGPQRSGAPTKTYVKISAKPIRNHEPIVDPDVAVVLDDTLLKSEKVDNNLSEDESLIINTKKTGEEIRSELSEFRGNIKVIDANEIAYDVMEKHHINGVMLGKLIQVTEIVDLETAKKEFQKIFEKKLGQELVRKNILAMEKGYDNYI
ncbi:MAG TPA: pyruvate synthase [Candidatus Moranbacteria bacterium]|nr:pyruvate synthase [Candidatus Moranbacteria bacterium]